MTFFNVFKIYKNIQLFLFDNLRNVSKTQQYIQIKYDFATFTTCFASNTFVSKISLNFIFFNKRAVIDFVNFLLFLIKRIRLISLVFNICDRKFSTFVFNIRDRKFSAFCVSKSFFVNIRFIQSIIIKCESLKKKISIFKK